MLSAFDWIDEISERCSRSADQEQMARERFNISVQYRQSVFDQLVAQMRGDIEYFRSKCPEASALLQFGDKVLRTLHVWTHAPYDSHVYITAIDARINY